MAIRVDLSIVFTEDEFESLSFEKQGIILDNMLTHQDWDIEILRAEFLEVNMESDYEEEE